MEYCSAIKRKELLIHAATSVSLPRITLSEKKTISQSYMLYDYIYILIMEIENRLVVAKGSGEVWAGGSGCGHQTVTGRFLYMESSEPGLCQCQVPVCYIVLQCCKMLPLRGTGVYGILLYYFLQSRGDF